MFFKKMVSAPARPPRPTDLAFRINVSNFLEQDYEKIGILSN